MKTAKLRDLCEFKNGLWTGKKEPYIRVGVIRNTNFTKNGVLDDSEIAQLDVEVNQYKSRKLKYGDIILEKSGGGPKQPVGRVIVFDKRDGEFSFSNFTSIIRVKDPEILDFNYLHRFLYGFYVSGKTESMQKHTTGIRNLNFDEYKDIDIPLPSLDSQRKIVAKIDMAFKKIDLAIEMTQKNIINAQIYPSVWLSKVFAEKSEFWKKAKLSDIAEFKGGGTPSKAIKEFWNGDIPWVSPKDMKSLEISDSIDHISQSAIQKSSTNIIEVGAVLLVVRSGILAHTIPLATNTVKVTLNQDMKAIVPKSGINSEFMFSILLALRKSISNFVSKGATVHRINSDQLRSLSISYPESESEQLQFALECKRVMQNSKKLLDNFNLKLQKLQILKMSALADTISEGNGE